MWLSPTGKGGIVSGDLVPFSMIDEDDEDQWSPEQREAASFLGKMDWEGGIAGLLYYDTGAFPEDLRAQAEFTYQALEDLNTSIDQWANERGVSY